MNNPPKILIFEDAPTDISSLSHILKENGYEVRNSDNYREIYKIVESEIPDLILLDDAISDINDHEIYYEIKQNKLISEIPVIFATSKSEFSEIAEKLESDNIDYITKPYKPLEAIARIRTHLKMKAMYEQNLFYQKELLASQKLVNITTLAGGIAHNINNLMGAVVGYSDMLRLSLKQQEKSRDYANKILEASQRVTELTHNLLTYSRSIRSEPSNTKINDLLENMLLLYGNGDKKNINLKLNIPDDIPDVYVDSNQICRALANIYLNAINVTPEGETVTISVSVSNIPKNIHLNGSENKADMYVVISVSDSGLGLDEESANQIFEPFFTRKQTAVLHLGLSAASGIIQKNNGFIHIDTKSEKGTTFNIYLPKSNGELK
jgi:signal transduction histidine kinase